MKQQIKLFEFFINKVPIQKVEYLEGSQILTNFSVHFTTSSLISETQNEKSQKELKKKSSESKSFVSTLSTSNKYKEMFLNIEDDKKKRSRRMSYILQK